MNKSSNPSFGRPSTDDDQTAAVDATEREFAQYSYSLLHSLQRIAITKGHKNLAHLLELAKLECTSLDE